MDRKIYKAFTLTEMLIVMGILIILMVVGVAAGRFAINRANEIANRNGATQLYQAMQAHYTDYGKFPQISSEGVASLSAVITGESGQNTIGQYLDMGSFGGKDATYFYLVDGEFQSMLICVTLGGIDDEGSKGIVCAGNGFSDSDVGVTVTTDKVETDDDAYSDILEVTDTHQANFEDKSF